MNYGRSFLLSVSPNFIVHNRAIYYILAIGVIQLHVVIFLSRSTPRLGLLEDTS